MDFGEIGKIVWVVDGFVDWRELYWVVGWGVVVVGDGVFDDEVVDLVVGFFGECEGECGGGDDG